MKLKDGITRPWQPAPDLDEFDIGSIKAFFSGTADERHQIRARDAILFKLCRISDQQYWPDSQRDTDFALGMRSVGLQIVKLSKLKTGSALPPLPPKATRPRKAASNPR
jgi:hypothetical protein